MRWGKQVGTARAVAQRLVRTALGALGVGATAIAPASADMLQSRSHTLPSVERLVGAAAHSGDVPIDLALPLYRRSSNTVYLNLRAQGGVGTLDGDVAVGYRGTVDEALAVGGYVLGVVERNERGFGHRQVTLGAEALVDWMRFNGNLCLPETGCASVVPPAPAERSWHNRALLEFAATALDIGGAETPGLDAELGLRVSHPVGLPGEWRFAAGASRMHDWSAGLEASAPRGRLEITFTDALESAGIRGARFIFGGEVRRNDETRNAAGVVSARLNMPLYSPRDTSRR